MHFCGRHARLNRMLAVCPLWFSFHSVLFVGRMGDRQREGPSQRQVWRSFVDGAFAFAHEGRHIVHAVGVIRAAHSLWYPFGNSSRTCMQMLYQNMPLPGSKWMSPPKSYSFSSFAFFYFPVAELNGRKDHGERKRGNNDFSARLPAHPVSHISLLETKLSAWMRG